MMKRRDKIQLVQRPAKIFFIICIFLYPFIHSFIGIDLGDTGYHLYAFENLYKEPELIGFTSYFTTFLGWAWLKVFPGLGLWGLNLLEVILEMIMAFTVYKVLSPHLGKLQTLAGILFSVTASDTYLNVFNYHQFNVFLLILILSFQFLAITKEKRLYSFWSGICFGIIVSARMGSITAIVTCFLYVFWYLIHDKKSVFIKNHMLSFLAGVVLAFLGILTLLTATGQLQYFINNIFRLSGLAASSEGGYGMNSLWDTFIFGNLDAIAVGAVYLAAFLVLLLGIGLIFRKTELIKHKIVNILIGAIATGIAVYQMIYAYNMNPVPNWPQMTTGPAFIIGIFYVIAFLCLSFHLYGGERKNEIALICVMAFMLPLLTIAGSNTGTKHVILGLWFIAPIAVYVFCEFLFNEKVYETVNIVLEKIGIMVSKAGWIVSLSILLICFSGKFLHMLYYTMNFESVDRSMINSRIDSPKLKFLLTTEREADAVNGVLKEVGNKDVREEHPLLVFGGSIMYYYLTEMDSFVQPWFTNGVYSLDSVQADINKGYKKFDNLPVVIYGRTNNYYGFYSYDYEIQLENERYNTYSGKKEMLLDFLEKNEYSLQYMNDYYLVFYPPDIQEEVNTDYREYIINEGN